MSDSVQLMPGQSAPFAIVTPTDQRGVLWIVTAFCLATAITSLLIRAYVRVEFSQSYGKDDISISGAFIAFVIQSALVIYEVKQGIGRTLADVNPNDLSTLQKTSYTSDLFYIITLWTTKLSVILLLARLTASHTKNMLLTKIMLAVTSVLGLVSFLIIALQCSLSAPWNFIGKHCTGQAARWETVAVFDIVTELAIFFTLCFIMWDVQLRLSKKATVVVGFAVRLLMIPPIALRLHYVLKAVNTSDPTLKLTDVVIVTEVELVMAIVSATIPCLRPFMAATHTTWGGRVDTVAASGYHAQAYANGKGGSGSGSKSAVSKIRSMMNRSATDTTKSQDDIPMKPVSHRGKKSGTGWEDLDHGMAYPPVAPKERDDMYMNTVSEDQQSSGSQEDSQKLIIRRDLEWTVHHEPRASITEGHHQTQEDINGHYLRGV